MKKVLIVDDHPVIRAAVRLVLEGEGFKLIFEASSVREALSILREHEIDLMVLDLSLSDGDGLTLMERIAASDRSCRVVVFTASDPSLFQQRCMHAGAMAYVAKTTDLSQLQKAVHAVKAGYTFFKQLSSGPQDLGQRSEKQRIDELSTRELAVLRYLAQGMTNKAIAERMNLSVKTTSTYTSRLVEKLGVKSKVFLPEFVTRNGLF
ncbi:MULTISPECIES: response regulator transcription factor [Pseudomonas]|jgi:two-component system response regulator EvgA|uniref:Two-component system response regulator EvgA n=2 Tax=Pseudomonas TaxID=286 RepID=A0ACC5M962_9PSED|nr:MULTISPECIES: response regulator transcription factor [Pseudomonas]ATE76814.1 DNA-binding response regulator [Pseudomonas frederiksbergensis]MBB2885163.1 two-component system response regulator EvgA [Pseudomonas umsongensis]NMN74805.1 two-component system response regulator EvgA [Pseudomonas sp. KD5]CAH0320430.1 Virulence factors putative positive transcription regulator BvgA [Pseudomonas sp. Bi123]GID04671.1 DNA-binding response regulator [Pseudomonas sp. 008]